MNGLPQSILKTLVYFDIFDYPLTLAEIWQWLYYSDNTDGSLASLALRRSGQIARRSLADVSEALTNLLDKVETKNGFYFLSGRQEIIQTRLQRYSTAEKKYCLALKYAGFFRALPFVKMIAVCNTLAYSNSSSGGDIDFFIIAQPKRLWLTRLLVVGWLKLLNKRPTPESKQDAIDTNFFLSANSLNIEYLNTNDKSPDSRLSLGYWVDQLVVLYDEDSTFQKFKLANSWIKKQLPNAVGYQPNSRRRIGKSLWSTLIGGLLAIFLDWDFMENLVKKIQLDIMPEKLRSMMNKDSRVLVNNKILKFHLEDKREKYLKTWQEKFYEISQ